MDTQEFSSDVWRYDEHFWELVNFPDDQIQKDELTRASLAFSIGLLVTYICTFIVASRARKEIEDHETPEFPDLPGIIKPINRPTLVETHLPWLTMCWTFCFEIQATLRCQITVLHAY